VQVENTDSNGWDVYWIDCDNNNQTTYVGPFSIETLVCAKQSSWFDFSLGLLSYTETGDCLGVNNTCLATATPTPSPTPTNTPVPTPTPLPNYTVAIYAKRGGTPTCIIPPGSGAETEFRIYFTFGAPMALQLVGGSVASNTCNFVGNITVPSGTTLRIGCRSFSYNTPIGFNVASGTSTCPSQGTDYCGTFYDYQGAYTYSQVITGNTTLAFTAAVFGDGKGGCSKFSYNCP
jgi:hypothetical protein